MRGRRREGRVGGEEEEVVGGEGGEGDAVVEHEHAAHSYYDRQ